MVKKERSTVNFVQLQNDCPSLQGDSANMGQSRLREDCENTFLLNQIQEDRLVKAHQFIRLSLQEVLR